MSEATPPDISILVVAYDMARELPRTLLTLSRAVQRDVGSASWEVVVLDNGSDPPVDADALQSVLPGVRVVRPAVIHRSPAAAINSAIHDLKGPLLGLWIDGARLASPGIVARALEAWRTDRTRAISTLAFHLGPDVQMRTVPQGYDAAVEDRLLESVAWRKDGYRLFDISVLAGSSRNGWFGPISETNGLFLDRELWKRAGGLDERFEAPGGGCVNIDLWQRLVELSDCKPWLILGEGTFHQVHGGAATNGTADDRDAMFAEFATIRGGPFEPLRYTSMFVGSLDQQRFSRGARHPLDDHRRVHAVRNRAFRVDLPTEALARIQSGTLQTRYKGLRLAKNPFDLALYMKLLEQLRPRAIIEIGTSEGGSASWLIDQCQALGLSDTQLISIDIMPPALALANVSIHSGDSYVPEESFPNDLIAAAPHPWLVIEDSAHTFDSTRAVMHYFDRRLISGDMLIVEDGSLADLDGDVYRKREDGPNRAVHEFLSRTGDRYQIDTELCDFYGDNVTYAPNAWLRRV